MYQIVVILIPLVALTIFSPLLMQRLKRQYVRYILLTIFGVYICGNLYFTLISRTPGTTEMIDLIPFSTYSNLFELYSENTDVGTSIADIFLFGILPVEGLILNVLLYYPLGYLLYTLYPNVGVRKIIFIGCLCSILTEAIQFLFKMGWCEMDDSIHNTLGTTLGVWIAYLQAKREERLRE